MSVSAMHLAARLYYLEDLSQSEIAMRLGVSRSTVSRLLRRARELDIVRIEVRSPGTSDELSAELVERLDLRRAVVIGRAPAEATFAALAVAAADLLASVDLDEGSVVALAGGRTIWALSRASLPRLPGVILVPTVGAMAQQEAWFQTNEIVRTAAVATGGTARFLHAPALPSPELRRALLDDRDTREVLSLWDRIDVALVGIGAPPATLGDRGPMHIPYLDPALRDAVGDVSTRYFDLSGEPLLYPGEDRLLGVSREQLRRAETVIGVSAGDAKARAIVGAARARLVDVVVTDEPTALEALEVAQATPGSREPQRSRRAPAAGMTVNASGAG